MSRAFLLHRHPALAPWTSHPHWLWVHPGVRGRGGVSLLISCSLLPPPHPQLIKFHSALMGFPPYKRYRKFQKGRFSSDVLRKIHVEISLMSYLQQLWNLRSSTRPPNSTGALSISADIVPYSVPTVFPFPYTESWSWKSSTIKIGHGLE